MLQRVFLSIAIMWMATSAKSMEQSQWDMLNKRLEMTEQGALLELNEHGFNLISDVLEQEVLNDLDEIAISDFDYTIPVILKLKMSGISVKPEIKKLTVKPSENGLIAEVLVKNLSVKVNQIRLENPLISSIGSTCHQTRIDVGNHHDMPVKAKLGVVLNDQDQVKIQSEQFDFSIQKDQYSAQGPQKCVGIFGIPDYLTKLVLSLVLKHSKGLIEKTLKSQISNILPTLETKINEMSQMQLPVVVPDILMIPETRMTFSFAPSSLAISEEKLSLELKIRVDGEQTLEKSVLEKERDLLSFATIGINPEVINQIFAVLLQSGTRELELSPSLHEMFSTILRVEELAYFWPDLAEISTDSPYMKLFAKIDEAPVLGARQNPDQISGVVPSISLRAQIKKDGVWINYFNLYASLGMGVSPVLADGSLNMTLEAPTLSIGGHWADTYQPVNGTFEREEMEALFSQLLGYLVTSQSPVIFSIPAFSVFGHDFTVDQFRVDQPYMKIDIAEIISGNGKNF